MSKRTENAAAEVFFALGDRTRLAVVSRLGLQGAMSATALAARSGVTRQAIAKHLQVLARARLVTPARQGREVVYALDPARFATATEFLDALSRRWDDALGRLRALVETNPD